MNDRQCKLFIEVARVGSFSRVAQEQYVSTQSVAQQIGRLEREVGVRLLDRSARGVSLTEAGKIFYEGICEVDRTMTGLVSRCRGTLHSERGLIRIGCSENYTLDLIRPIVPDFLRMHPDVDIDYVNVGPDPHKDLLAGTYDIVESIEPAGNEASEMQREGIAFVPIMRSRRACFVLPRNPLAHKSSIAPEDLVGKRVYVYNLKWARNLRAYLDKRCPQVVLHELPYAFTRREVRELEEEDIVYLFPEQMGARKNDLICIPFDADVSTVYGAMYLASQQERLAGIVEATRAAFTS